MVVSDRVDPMDTTIREFAVLGTVGAAADGFVRT
jgi:hypothetical protein